LLGERKVFEKVVLAVENSGFLGLETAACGQRAISVALSLAQLLRVYFKLIHYSNSADISLDFSRVVGYAAIGGYLRQNKNDEKFFLDKEPQKEALKIVKDTLKKSMIGKR